MTTQLSLKEKIKLFFHEIFPVSRKELTKFSLYCLLFIIILLQYTLLRITKDSVVNAFNSTTSPIPYLKSFFVPISAVLFAFLNNKLLSKFKHRKTFYIIFTYFIVFFTVYGFLLYPYADKLCLKYFKVANEISHASSAKTFMFNLKSILYNWHHSLFYIHVELLPAVIALFWHFFNQTLGSLTSVFTAPMLMISQISVALAGAIELFLVDCHRHPSKYKWIIGNVNEESNTMKLFFKICMIIGILGISTYYIINKMYVTEEMYTSSKKKNKKVSGFREFFNSSTPVLLISFILIFYNACISMIDIHFKSSVLKSYLTHKLELGGITNFAGNKIFKEALLWSQSEFQARCLLYQAAFTVLLAIIRSGLSTYRKIKDHNNVSSVRKTTAELWLSNAMFSTIAVIIGSLALFGSKLHFIRSLMEKLIIKFQITTVQSIDLQISYYLVVISAIIIIILKSAKYISFDAAKEQATRQLPVEEQVLSKSLDPLAARAGKSIGSFNVLYSSTTGAAQNPSPIPLIFSMIISALWTYSNFRIYDILFKKREKRAEEDNNNPKNSIES